QRRCLSRAGGGLHHPTAIEIGNRRGRHAGTSIPCPRRGGANRPCFCPQRRRDAEISRVMRKHLIRGDENRGREGRSISRRQSGYSQPIPKAGIGGSPRFAANARIWHFRESAEKTEAESHPSGLSASTARRPRHCAG